MKKKNLIGSIGSLLAISGAVGGAYYLKSKNICPICEAKKLIAKTKMHYIMGTPHKDVF